MIKSKAYDYGQCGCGNRTDHRQIEVRMTIAGTDVVIDSVPQGTCSSCGSRYYKADILETIEALMLGHKRERRSNSGPI